MIKLFGVPLVDWNTKKEGWYFQLFFLAIFWHRMEKRVRIGIGAPFLSLAIDSQHGIGLCVYAENVGFQLPTSTTIVLLLAAMLISQLKWWTVLLGLMMSWATSYTEKDILVMETGEGEEEEEE